MLRQTVLFVILLSVVAQAYKVKNQSAYYFILSANIPKFEYMWIKPFLNYQE